MIAYDRGFFEVYKQLWGNEMINVWERPQFTEFLSLLASKGHSSLVEHHLLSPVGTNIFLSLSVQEKVTLVHNLYK